MRSLIAAIITLAFCLTVRADQPTDDLTPIERRLALAVAKVCVNESAFNSPADCALIYQTAEARADTPASRLHWLRQHSSCVLDSTQEEADRSAGLCRWTRNLDRSLRRPHGYRGPWRPELWERVLRLADGLVSGRVTRRPCNGDPFTWDGRDWRDEVLASGRFRLLECEGTKNDGWALPLRRRAQQGSP